MFLGHYALAFGAKRFTPRTSLGTLTAAATLADLLWPVFLLPGWERVTVAPATDPFLALTFDAYPISHSLVVLAAWGVAFAALYRWRRRLALQPGAHAHRGPRRRRDRVRLAIRDLGGVGGSAPGRRGTSPRRDLIAASLRRSVAAS